jgi:hypothetical protein
MAAASLPLGAFYFRQNVDLVERLLSRGAMYCVPRNLKVFGPVTYGPLRRLRVLLKDRLHSVVGRDPGTAKS